MSKTRSGQSGESAAPKAAPSKAAAPRPVQAQKDVIPPAPSLSTTTQALTLKAGRYVAQHLGIEGSSTALAGRLLPFALLFAPDRAANGSAISFVGSDGGGLARLLTPGDRSVIDVKNAEGTVFFVVFNAAGAEAGVRLGLKRLPDQPAAPAAPSAMQITAHLQDIGDQKSRGASWAGLRGSRLRLEGFRADVVPALPGVEVECGIVGADRQMRWAGPGGFAGSRGRARAVAGFGIRLKGDRAGLWDIVYQGHFTLSGDSVIHRNGEVCHGKSEGDVLVAMRASLVGRGAAPDLAPMGTLSKMRSADVVEIGDAVAASGSPSPGKAGRPRAAGGATAPKRPAQKVLQKSAQKPAQKPTKRGDRTGKSGDGAKSTPPRRTR